MKKTIFAFLAVILFAFAGRADQTPTNAVKGSALPLATTPLAGSESVILIQSGVTKTATVAQTIAAATAQATATSNALNTAVLTTGTNLNTASNLLSLRIGTNTTATTTASNLLSLRIGTNTTLIAATSNALNATISAASNTVAAAALSNLQATNATLAGQIAAVQAGIGSAVTNGGAVSLGRASIGAIKTPSVMLGTYAALIDIYTGTGGNATNLDLSAGSRQFATVTAGSSTYLLRFNPTNCADGQNVFLMIRATSACYVGTVATVPGFNVVSYLAAGATFFAVPARKTAILNWEVYGGTNLVFSGGAQP